jgi:RNA polymerase sigma-70 factor, ECF subfamily
LVTDSGVLKASDAATVLEALACVDQSYRMVLELFYLADLSYKEIAVNLDIPIGTVMSRLSRGKEQLRTLLAKTEPPDKIPRPN